MNKSRRIRKDTWIFIK